MDKFFEGAWENKLAETEKMLDPTNGFIYEEINGINYHTAVSSGRVHRLRENAEYITALLTEGDAAAEKKAHIILEAVLKEQDKDSAHETFGIWPYLFEEPLTEMKNPDWNWASFIGRVLLVLLDEFPEKLTEEEIQAIKEALQRACTSIVRRNMAVDYTNISLMSSFVLVRTSEILKDTDFFERGRQTLERQLDFIQKNGGYAEYNSPYYGVIDIEETGRILKYCANDEVLATARRLHDAAWHVFATHFHYATRQIAPPHARCYADIQNSRVPSLIQIGTKENCSLVSLQDADVDLMWRFTVLDCPKSYYVCFAPMKDHEERFLQEDFYKGYDPIRDDETRILLEKGLAPISSSTYFCRDYCIGTFSKHDMWNQRRPLMAYFRTEHGVVCFRARCMNGNMDFSSAVMSSVQARSSAAGGVPFVTDHGDYHYILTPLVNGCFRTSRFSFRFAVEGSLEDADIVQLKDSSFRFDIGNASIHLMVPHALFGGREVKAQLFDTADDKGIEFVFYEGPEKNMDLANAGECVLLYNLEITPLHAEPETVCAYRRQQDRYEVQMKNAAGQILQQTEVPVHPGRYLQVYRDQIKRYRKGGFYYTDK